MVLDPCEELSPRCTLPWRSHAILFLPARTQPRRLRHIPPSAEVGLTAEVGPRCRSAGEEEAQIASTLKLEEIAITTCDEDEPPTHRSRGKRSGHPASSPSTRSCSQRAPLPSLLHLVWLHRVTGLSPIRYARHSAAASAASSSSSWSQKGVCAVVLMWRCENKWCSACSRTRSSSPTTSSWTHAVPSRSARTNDGPHTGGCPTDSSATHPTTQRSQEDGVYQPVAAHSREELRQPAVDTE